MIRRLLMLGAALAAAACLAAGAASPASAGTPNAEMRDAILIIRGLVDRQAAADYFVYPTRSRVRAGRLGASWWWPRDPWTGSALQPGTGRGHYRYTVTPDRRRYRLVGYLDGDVFAVNGGMPHSIILAYDHRGEEGINLIRQYIEEWAQANDGLYPLPADADADGAVGTQPEHRYWPSNPWDHKDMRQAKGDGSFAYAVTADRTSYTLRLHRALKPDYVLSGATATSGWQQMLVTLEDEILRRNGRILSGYVDQWWLQNGKLPQVAELAADGAVGAAHADWPEEPIGGGDMRQGTLPGTYTFSPGATGTYTLTIHLHSEDFEAGGTAPAPAAPARDSGPAEP